MDAYRQAHAAFHVTGRIADAHLAAIDGRGFVPAVMAGRRDLVARRHDFPLVLVARDGTALGVQALSGLVDDLLERIAVDDDRLRHRVRDLEHRIRALVDAGERPTLAQAWQTAARELVVADPSAADDVARATSALDVDGRLVPCDRDAAGLVLAHVWEASRGERSARFHAEADRLVVRLGEILQADYLNSAEARDAEHLRGSFGAGPADDFDFEAMSAMLTRAEPPVALPEARRRRVARLLEVLREQRFYPRQDGPQGYGFVFRSAAEALEAFGARLPEALDVATALAVGRLEVDGEYVEATHDPIFESVGSAGLDPGDLAVFPDYLLLLDLDELPAEELELLDEILASGLPFTVLARTDDVVSTTSPGRGHTALALASRRLTGAALGLGDVFVVQAPGSHLLRVAESLRRAVDYPGTALVSVFSGDTPHVKVLPPYLVAAAALESRVFPAFVLDPAAGDDWGDCFSLAGNPQPQADWAAHDVAYQDAACTTVRERLPFTLADLVVCDDRYARHFAEVPPEAWGDALVPVDAAAARAGRTSVEQVPHLLVVDDDDIVHRVLVDEAVLREAVRVRAMWSRLQEQGGVRNPVAERLLAEQEAIWVDRLAAAEAAAAASPAAAGATVVGEAAATVDEVADAEAADVLEEPPVRDPDESYIETARCSTCNECTQINAAMFAYNDNQQAYIKDLRAGTYAQLVEAAESCQVSVIHPGKPWNPTEPGLDELLARAEVFR